jgi:hypothetical protein
MIYGKACRLSAYCLTCLIEENITLVGFLVAMLIVSANLLEIYPADV